MRLTAFIAALAALVTATAAPAAIQTITRTGRVVAQIAPDGFFNLGTTSIPGVAVGDALSFSATYDDADLVNPGTVLTFLGEPVAGPNFRVVGLGNGNPVNSVSITLGTHAFQLSDQACFQNPACIAAAGMEFPTGPTLLFDAGRFLGLDSCLVEGGGGFGTGVTLCSLVLDNLAPTLQSINTDYLGYTRSDIFLVNAANGDTVFMAQFDGPGIANLSVPEPATWAMLILGFGVVGGAARRRRVLAVA